MPAQKSAPPDHRARRAPCLSTMRPANLVAGDAPGARQHQQEGQPGAGHRGQSVQKGCEVGLEGEVARDGDGGDQQDEEHGTLLERPQQHADPGRCAWARRVRHLRPDQQQGCRAERSGEDEGGLPPERAAEIGTDGHSDQHGAGQAGHDRGQVPPAPFGWRCRRGRREGGGQDDSGAEGGYDSQSHEDGEGIDERDGEVGCAEDAERPEQRLLPVDPRQQKGPQGGGQCVDERIDGHQLVSRTLAHPQVCGQVGQHTDDDEVVGLDGEGGERQRIEPQGRLTREHCHRIKVTDVALTECETVAAPEIPAAEPALRRDEKRCSHGQTDQPGPPP